MQALKKVLVVEDDISISRFIKLYLEREDWDVHCAFDAKNAVSYLNSNTYNLVLLDLMLGNMRGESICRDIRKKSDVPVIIVSAKSREQDKLMGFHLGADDYIVKPFSLNELVARVHAVTRRYQSSTNKSNILSFDNRRLRIDNDKCIVYMDNKVIELTSTELKILNILASKPNCVFSRASLVCQALNSSYCENGRVIDVHIRKIRQKIEPDEKNPRYIVTVVNLGYKFGVEADEICS